jgi:hypothetical protein
LPYESIHLARENKQHPARFLQSERFDQLRIVRTWFLTKSEVESAIYLGITPIYTDTGRQTMASEAISTLFQFAGNSNLFQGKSWAETIDHQFKSPTQLIRNWSDLLH